MQILENIPLAPLTTFQVGGPARYFIEATGVEEIREATHFAETRGLPLFVLGGGSNIVVADAGWPGMVLKVGLSGIVERSKGLFEVGAGEDWDRFVAYSVDRNCAGIECLSGIPGTVGGTPVQNVGAYGEEVAEAIETVHVFDLKTGEFKDLSKRECGFLYRSSIFNARDIGRYIVLRVTYALAAGGEPRIEYADLRKLFGSRKPTLHETRDAVRSIRHSKAMLIVAGDENCRSAGSFFKNPILPVERFCEIKDRHPEIANWPAGEGRVKISAAWLLEHAGFHKGWRRGGVGISSKHALAIVNRGGATAAEIVALKDEIQRRVLDQFAVSLLPEPVFLGFGTLKNTE